MSKLTEYIDSLKKDILNSGKMYEEEILRYIYIKLGKKMDFDLNYTFGNSKAKSKIYNTRINEDELSHIVETHTAICKSLSYLFERILKEFNINAITVEDPQDERKNKHIYNIVKLENGKRYKFDLEDDLEYIQSGAKTKYFGLPLEPNGKPMLSENELRSIDKNIIGYIPEGYYLEDILWMLKKAVSSNTLTLSQKMDFVLQNIDKYVDNENVSYREKTKYHERVIKEVFTEKERRKIQFINCYTKNNDKKTFQTCITIDKSSKNNPNDLLIYLYSLDKNTYEQISKKDLKNRINNGLNTLQNIRYLKEREER